MHLYYLYILCSNNNNAIYVGVTNDLVRRVFEHKKKMNNGFTSKYNINKLVYYEVFDFIDLAIKREKQIKNYPRKRKNELINSFNPDWSELYNNGVIKSR